MKGQTWKVAMYFIVLVVFLLTIIFWIGDFKLGTEEYAQRNACEQSARNAAKLTDNPKQYRHLLQCPTFDRTIEGNPAEQKYEIAEELRKCKEMLKWTDVRGIFCHPCTTLQFKNQGKLTGLREFIEKRRVPGTQDKYASTLCEETMKSIDKAESGGMDTTKQWMVMYRYHKNAGIPYHCPLLVENSPSALKQIDCG